MIVLILFISLLVLAGLERIIYIKKHKDWDRIRPFICVLIICLLFLISYYITDTSASLFYVFFLMLAYISIVIIFYRSHIRWLKYLSSIIGLPAIVYFIINITQKILINPSYIFLFLATMNAILAYPYKDKKKSTRKENLAFVIGIVFAGIIIFSYYKLWGSDSRILIKQEIIGQKYLEEEMDIHGLDVYRDNFSGSLRGQEARLNAYYPHGPAIILIYINNEIISHEIGD